jgi:hypothetical protein
MLRRCCADATCLRILEVFIMVRTLNLRGLLVAAAVSAAFPLACSSSSTTTPPKGDGGGTSTSGGSKGSHSGGSNSSAASKSKGSSEASKASSSSKSPKDSGIEDAPKAHTDASGAGCGDTATLYTRLGGHAGIHSAVVAIVGKELMNADIASYFFFQTTGAAPTDGHPSPAQIEECFTYFVGSALGGAGESYPVKLSADAGGYQCRDLKLAHKALQINANTFATFLQIAGNELIALGVCTADLNTLAGALEGTAVDVVTVPGDAAVAPFPPNKVDAALHIAPDAG